MNPNDIDHFNNLKQSEEDPHKDNVPNGKLLRRTHFSEALALNELTEIIAFTFFD